MQTNILEVLVKGVPESLLAILCLYFFCKVKPKLGQLFLLWAILMVVTYFTRMIMTGYGMSLLMTMVVLLITFPLIVKIPLTNVIRGTLLLVIFLIVSEAINFLFIQICFPEKLESVLYDASTRIIYTIPSTVLLAVQVFALNIVRRKNHE